MKAVKVNPKVDTRGKIKGDGDSEKKAAAPRRPRPLSGYNLTLAKK